MLAQELSEDQVVEACGAEPSLLCQFVADQVDSVTVVRLTELLIGRPSRIIMILVVAWLIARILRRTVLRIGAKVVHERAQRRAEAIEQRRQARPSRFIPGVDRNRANRAELRINTLVAVFASIAGLVVWAVAMLLVLGEFEINIAPLLAGAGVLGVALGFGAQSIVADFLAGAFMLLEDQYGVGDVIDAGEATGTVEEFSLRVTTLRDVNGTVWHIPNSEIRRVANKSQLWSRAVLDIEVAYDTDLRRAEGIIQRVADDLWQDRNFVGGTIIDPPEVWGVERLGPDGVAIRLVLKTDPAEQWQVARELRLRIKEALEEAGIEIPFPQRTIWMRTEAPKIPRHQRPNVPMTEPRMPAITEEMSLNPGMFNS